MNVIKSNLLWRDGKYIALFLLVSGILSALFFKFLLIPVIGLFIFSFYFFRNPERLCAEALTDKSVLICPADGKVVDVSDIQDGSYRKKISIFLSPLDVHVNWLPIDGAIKQVIYRPGKFVVAFAPKSSDINERNDVVIESKNGKTIIVRQIAGFVARRICCWVKENDNVQAGQKFGMIRFGSRVDIFLPENVEISLTIGDIVKGGQTVLGRWV